MNKKPIIILVLALIPALAYSQPAQRGPSAEGSKPETRERVRPGSEARPTRPQVDPETAQLFMLGRLVQMEPAQLDNLEKAIDKVRQMSAREKLEVLAKIEELQEQNRSRFQDRARQWQEGIPEEARREYGRRLQEMTPEQRAEHRKAMRELTPEERAERIRKGQP